MLSRQTVRSALRIMLAVSMVAVGVSHFTSPQVFLDIVPPWVPMPLAMVYVSGLFEIVGGAGLLSPVTRRVAGWGLIALYVAVFPANIHMAVNDVPFRGEKVPAAARYGRLPFQLVFIAWAYWVSKEEEEDAAGEP